MDPEEFLVFLGLRVNMDNLETQDNLEVVDQVDRRANQEIQVLKVFQDDWDP